MPRTVFVRDTHSKTPEGKWRSEAICWMKIRFGKLMWHYRTIGGVGQRNGVPDDLFLIAGQFVAIEWKRPDYRRPNFETAQDREIEAIMACGGRAAKVKSWDELEALLEGLPCVQMNMRMT